MTDTKTRPDFYSMAALEDRCCLRSPVAISGMLRPQGEKSFPVRVIDVSIAGFACEVITGLHTGKICWLTVPGMRGQEAKIIWNDGRTIGCAFANLLNNAVVDDVIARAR